MSILKISKRANDRQKINKDTINASVGVFILEDGTLSNELVDEFLKETNSHNLAPYLSVDGNSEYKDRVLNWVFKAHKDEILNKHNYSFFQTIGGSGAIDIVLNNIGERKDYVLVPNIAWDYKSFINKSDKRIFEYSLFDDDKFNMASFKEAINEVSKLQYQIIIVLNDPAHNPTGYTLTKKERNEIWELLNSYKNNEIIVLYDLAYYDYEPSYDNREVFLELNKLDKHVVTMLAVSASKSFSLYGTRVGALIALFKNGKMNEKFYNKAYSYVVGSYSAPVTYGSELLIHILKGNKDNHILKLKNELKIRRDIFINESKECGLEIHPSTSGFFFLIKSVDNEKDFEKLAKEDIFVIPMNEGLRISLSSLRKEQIIGLAKRIYNIIEN